MDDEKRCKYCEKLLERRRNSRKLEAARDFRRRQFCNKKCSSKYQHSKKQAENTEKPAETVRKAADMVASGNSQEKLTALQVLEEAANNKKLDWTTRINAAKALAPYQAKKASERTGVKEKREQNAKKAASGKFSAGAAPMARVK